LHLELEFSVDKSRQPAELNTAINKMLGAKMYEYSGNQAFLPAVSKLLSQAGKLFKKSDPDVAAPLIAFGKFCDSIFDRKVIEQLFFARGVQSPDLFQNRNDIYAYQQFMGVEDTNEEFLRNWIRGKK